MACADIALSYACADTRFLTPKCVCVHIASVLCASQSLPYTSGQSLPVYQCFPTLPLDRLAQTPDVDIVSGIRASAYARLSSVSFRVVCVTCVQNTHVKDTACTNRQIACASTILRVCMPFSVLWLVRNECRTSSEASPPFPSRRTMRDKFATT